MSNLNSDSFNKIHSAIENCYLEINKIFININRDKVYIKKEISELEGGSYKYIIELNKPNSLNEDDYGIAIDFSIYKSFSVFKVEIDILKTTGQLYYERSFVINEGIKFDSNRFFKDILAIPLLAASIYEKEYQ